MTIDIEIKQNEEMKKKLKKKEQELEELAVIAFMTGNMGGTYRMESTM